MKKGTEKLNVFDVESEKLEDMFLASFKKAIKDSKGDVEMDEIECVAEKNLVSKVVTMKVTVYGLAGTTSKSEFHDKKKSGNVKKGFRKINVGNYCFKFSDSFDLNTNDYVILYVNE